MNRALSKAFDHLYAAVDWIAADHFGETPEGIYWADECEELIAALENELARRENALHE